MKPFIVSDEFKQVNYSVLSHDWRPEDFFLSVKVRCPLGIVKLQKKKNSGTFVVFEAPKSVLTDEDIKTLNLVVSTFESIYRKLREQELANFNGL